MNPAAFAFIFAFLSLAFFIGSALIFRHFKKYGYLSPRFGFVVAVFGFIALAIWGTALYFMILLWSFNAGDAEAIPLAPSPPSGEIQF